MNDFRNDFHMWKILFDLPGMYKLRIGEKEEVGWGPEPGARPFYPQKDFPGRDTILELDFFHASGLVVGAGVVHCFLVLRERW